MLYLKWPASGAACSQYLREGLLFTPSLPGPRAQPESPRSSQVLLTSAPTQNTASKSLKQFVQHWRAWLRGLSALLGVREWGLPHTDLCPFINFGIRRPHRRGHQNSPPPLQGHTKVLEERALVRGSRTGFRCPWRSADPGQATDFPEPWGAVKRASTYGNVL